jgi:hypothetical protein
MVNVIVAAVTTVLAMVVYAKPFYYYLQTVYGGLSEYDLEYTEAMALSDADYTRIDTLFLLAALPVLVATVLALVNVATATNPEKKPAFIPAIIGFVLSAAGAALYIYGTFYIKGLLVDNPYVDGVELMYRFALFGGCFIAIIINAVLAFINIFSVKSGRNKWKETGRAY